MRRRTALLLLLAVVGLLGVGAGLSQMLLRSGVQGLRTATEERLRAIGLTTAQALGHHASEDLLPGVCRDNQLEGAYLLDRALHPLHTMTGGPPQGPQRSLSLLRIDPDRALRALGGQPSIGTAYRLDSLDPAAAAAGTAADGASAGGDPDEETVLAGYFPVTSGGEARLLVLEAGAAFVAAPQRLRHAAWGASAVGAALALLCLVAVLLAVRAAARERELYGQAERGRAISQMAAMVAHEIRNPLGTIRAGAELLREQTSDPELVGDIISEVERLNALTTEFLSLSRDPPLQLSSFDMAELCDEVCEGLVRRARAGGPPGLEVLRLGEARAPLVGDRDKLRQVLLNLTLNAVQALPGGGRLEVSVACSRGGVEVVVSDNGPGIEQHLSRRLFEPFATAKAGGTGLGLVIPRRVAEKHGGTLELLPAGKGRAEEKTGARFALRLPRRHLTGAP